MLRIPFNLFTQGKKSLSNLRNNINNFQGDYRQKFTGYRTQQDYDNARQNRINLKSIDRIQNTLNRKYPDGDYSNTNLDERLADLKQSMGIVDVATVNQINDRPTQTFSFDNSGMTRSNLNNIESLVAASQVPQNLFNANTFDDNVTLTGTPPPGMNKVTFGSEDPSYYTTPLQDDFIGQPQQQQGIMGIDVGYPSNDLMVGLTKQQQKMLAGPQKMGREYGNFSDQDILNNISPFNDPDDPATLKEVTNFYST